MTELTRVKLLSICETLLTDKPNPTFKKGLEQTIRQLHNTTDEQFDRVLAEAEAKMPGASQRMIDQFTMKFGN